MTFLSCGVVVGWDSQDSVGRIGFFGCTHKRASVFSVTGQSCISTVTELNQEQNTEMPEC